VPESPHRKCTLWRKPVPTHNRPSIPYLYRSCDFTETLYRASVGPVACAGRDTAYIGRDVVRNGLLKFIIGARKMDVVNVNIVSVINRVIGELTAVRDALNIVGTQLTDAQQDKPKITPCCCTCIKRRSCQVVYGCLPEHKFYKSA
jgi:hypothetical protein